LLNLGSIGHQGVTLPSVIAGTPHGQSLVRLACGAGRLRTSYQQLQPFNPKLLKLLVQSCHYRAESSKIVLQGRPFIPQQLIGLATIANFGFPYQDRA